MLAQGITIPEGHIFGIKLATPWDVPTNNDYTNHTLDKTIIHTYYRGERQESFTQSMFLWSSETGTLGTYIILLYTQSPVDGVAIEKKATSSRVVMLDIYWICVSHFSFVI